MKMNEDEFYKMLDIVEQFSDVTSGYYPTVEQLQSHKVEEMGETSLPFLAYYASDPLKKAGLPDADVKEYRDAVAYCKKLLAEVELEP